MKLSDIKIIGVLLVVLINLFGAQPAKAMNPLEEAYVTNFEKYVNAVVLEEKKWSKLVASPAFKSAPTSAKYKAVAKNIIRSNDKLTVTIRKLEALTAPESFASIEPFLKGWAKYYLELNALLNKSLAPKGKWTDAISEEVNDLNIIRNKYWEEVKVEYNQALAELQTPPTN
jgi:hypothetical protein